MYILVDLSVFQIGLNNQTHIIQKIMSIKLKTKINIIK